jgi:hypothetical protein
MTSALPPQSRPYQHTYLIYNEGGHPGSDELWAEASSEVGLSALQHRLNNLNTGIRIEVSAW